MKTELELFLNFQAMVALDTVMDSNAYYLPNSFLERLDEQINNDLTSIKTRFLLNGYCDRQYYPAAAVIQDFIIDRKFSSRYQRFIQDIICFPKQARVPKLKSLSDYDVVHGILDSSTLTRFNELIQVLFTEIVPGNISTLNDGTVITHRNLISRYYWYEEMVRRAESVGRNTDALRQGWAKFDCQNLTIEFLEIKGELLAINNTLNQLRTNSQALQFDEGSRDNAGNAAVKFDYPPAWKMCQFQPDYTSIQVIQGRGNFPNPIELSKALVASSAFYNLQPTVPSGSEEGITSDSFVVSTISFKKSVLSAKRNWLPDLDLFKGFLSSDFWSITKTNLFLDSGPVISGSLDDYLKSVVIGIVLLSEISISLENSEENRHFFSSISLASDTLDNYRLLGLNCNISLINDVFSVSIVEPAQWYLCGLLLNGLPRCPNPNQEKYMWGENAWFP